MIITSTASLEEGGYVFPDFIATPIAVGERDEDKKGRSNPLLCETGFPRNMIRELDMRPRGDFASGSLIRPIRPLTAIHDKGAIGRRAITFDPAAPSPETMGYALSQDIERLRVHLGSRTEIAAVIQSFFGAGRTNRKYRGGVPTGTTMTIERALIGSGVSAGFTPNGAAGLASFWGYVLKPLGIVTPCVPITILEDRFTPQVSLESFKAHASAIAIRDAIESIKFGSFMSEKTKDFYLDTLIESLVISFRQMLSTLRAAINIDSNISHALELIARYVVNPEDPTSLPVFMKNDPLLDSLSTNVTLVMMALEQRRQGGVADGMISLKDWSTEDHQRTLAQLDRLVTTSPRYAVVNLMDMRSVYGHEAIIGPDKTPRGVVIYQNASIDGKVQITNFHPVDDSGQTWYQEPAPEYEAIFTPVSEAVKGMMDTAAAARIITHSLNRIAEAIPHPIMQGICVSDLGVQEYAVSIAKEVFISVDPKTQQASLVYQVDVSHLNFPHIAFGNMYLTSDPAVMLMLTEASNRPTSTVEGKIQVIPDECRKHLITGSLRRLTESLTRTMDVKIKFGKKSYEHKVSLAEITNMWFSEEARITRSPLTSVVGSAYMGAVVNLVTYMRMIAEVPESALSDCLYKDMYSWEGIGIGIDPSETADPILQNNELMLDLAIGNVAISSALELQKILFHPTVKYLSRSVLWKIIESIPSGSERLELKNSLIHARHSIELHKTMAMLLLVRLGIVAKELADSMMNLYEREDVTLHLMRTEGSIAGPQ